MLPELLNICRWRPTGPDRGGHTGADATTDRPRWLPVAGLGLALFMATLDMTIVATTLPVIGRDLHAPPQHMRRTAMPITREAGAAGGLRAAGP
jgi:hypothetical protein